MFYPLSHRYAMPAPPRGGAFQQLDEEQLPLGHHNVVNAIVDAHSRSFAVVRSERVVHDLTIDKVAYDQKRQTQ